MTDLAEMVAKFAPLDMENDLRLDGNLCTLLFTCPEHAQEFTRALLLLVLHYRDVDER